MKIKICGIKQKENLQEIIKLKPDFIGFNFYPVSPRFIDNCLSPVDLAVIPRNIKKTGVFVNQDEYEISGIQWKYGLDYVQLHGDETPEVCKGLQSSGVRVIKAFRVDENFEFKELSYYIPFCDFFLFDALTEKFGGSGHKFDWGLLHKYDLGHPFFLSGGIAPEDAPGIRELSFSALAGVDINSRFEIQPGVKNILKLSEFMNSVRSS